MELKMVSTPFKGILEALEFIENTKLNICLYLLTNGRQHYITIFQIDNDIYNCNELYLSKKETIFVVLHFHISLIQIYYYNGIQKHVVKINYNDYYPNYVKIQQAWKKYRLRGARIRNDLVIRGLAEYWGHPSRVVF
jgi:hypothetical protein